MTQVCGKRRDPQRDLSKEIVEKGEDDIADEMPANDLKEADPETLKSRQRLRIVRSMPPPMAIPEAKKLNTESMADKENDIKEESSETTIVDKNISTASTEINKESTEESTDSKDKDSTIEKDTTQDKDSTADKESTKDSNTSDGIKPSNGLGLFSSHFNKDSTLFVSPFTSLASDTGSFFLNTSTNISAVESSNADDNDVPPAEEMTIISTTVDEDEESIFSEKDCRMQKFDHATKSWVPKPPLDGKVEIIAPKDGEDKKNKTRIVFYVNRTGKLQLNTPILPTSVGFRHPQNRAVCVPGEAKGESNASDTECLKKNTLEFIGLQMEAKDMKDTTFYRVRFPSDEKCAEFLKVVDQK